MGQRLEADGGGVEERGGRVVDLGEQVAGVDWVGALPVPLAGFEAGHDPEHGVAVKELRAVDLRGEQGHGLAGAGGLAVAGRVVVGRAELAVVDAATAVAGAVGGVVGWYITSC